MSGIFICYRRDDSAPWAGRVYDSLVRQWGEDHVFMDVDTIAPGEDFRAVISDTVTNSDVVLVVIGPDWVAAADTAGGRRLEDEGDIHRTEVVSALQSEVRVIPVLVGGASMPKVADLPDAIKELAFRNAVVLEDRRFGSDVAALNRALLRFAEERPTATHSPPGAVETPPPVAPLVDAPPSPDRPAAPTSPAVPPPGVWYPEPAAPPGPAAPVPLARHADRDGAWGQAAAAAGIGVGVLVFVTGLTVANYWTNPTLLLRAKDVGAGLLPSVLAGAALTVAAGLALDPRRRLMMLGTALGVALPLGFIRLEEGAEVRYWCNYDCVTEEASLGVLFTLSGPLALVAAILCAVALWRGGALSRSPWALPRLAVLTIVAAALWLATFLLDFYDLDGEHYGSVLGDYGVSATVWAILAGLAIVGLAVAAFLLLDREPGTGVLIGVGGLALIAVVNEFAYLAGGHESPTSSAMLWLMVIPALAVIGLVVVVAAQARHPTPAPTPDG